MATGTIKTPMPILFRNVQRTVTQNSEIDYWNMQVEFPPKSGYSRVIFGLLSDNQNVVITGWQFGDDNMPQWLVRRFGSSAISNVTYYATLMYIPDVNAWS